ncbi:echinoderm microtubule-associated protein-like 4 [Eucyclogobius newberryi]|uniref:echinoderm microtubule-associated protein-like 4 n=1 Tax=Eucyclogobius newberryi TaxID=166745 RepID=UPI003B5BBBEB
MDGSLDEDVHEDNVHARVCALESDEHVHARVCALELRVQTQEDELTVLKAALADVIRRLNQSEESKKQTKGSMREAYSLSCLPNGGTSGGTSGSGRRRDRESGSVTRKETLSSAAKSGTEKKKEKSQSRSDLGEIQEENQDQNQNLQRSQSSESRSTEARTETRAETKVQSGATGKRGGSARRSLDRTHGSWDDDSRLHKAASTSKLLARVAKQAHRRTGAQPLLHLLLSLALHPDKIRIATGQIAGVDKDGRALAPHVRVWDSVSLCTLQIIGQGTFERGVGSLAFSKADSGVHLAVVDDCNDHMLTVWDWNRKSKVAEIKTTNEVVLGVEFHPTDSASIVTCGKSHIFFWTWSGNSLQRKQGIFGKFEKPKFVQCVAFLRNGDILTGDSGGVLLVWTRSADTPTSKGLRAFQIVRQVKAHEGSVLCLSLTRGGAVLSGGSKDRRVVLWDHELRPDKDIEVPDHFGSIRAVAEGKGDKVLVGTSKNFILRGTFTEGFSVEVQGHTDELWGLASHPSRDLFLTCAQDRLVCLWDSDQHRLKWSRSLEEHGHCADFHPSGAVVTIGTHSGKWYVLDAESTDLVAIHTDGNEQLSVMRFSVDGSLLAVGSHDNFIYLYTVSENGRKYSRYNKCSGHSSYITHLDWSPDNSFIMSNSGDYEILYWDVVNGCSQIKNRSDCKDTEWATYTCVLGFHVFGVWPEGSDGTDINALVRSHNRRVVALADDFCKVHLFSYPCCTPKAPSHKYSAHSSHVTNVSFLHSDSHLISTGGKDMSILQWRLVESGTGPAPKSFAPSPAPPTANGETEPELTPPPSELTPPTSDTVSLKDSLEPTPPATPPS